MFDKIKPAGKFGAWELVARWEEADIDVDSFAEDIEFEKRVLGVNWYANNNVRISANYVDAETEGDAVNGEGDDDGDAFTVRAQYVW